MGVDTAAGGTDPLAEELAELMNEFAGPEAIADWTMDDAVHGIVPIQAGVGPRPPLPPLAGEPRAKSPVYMPDLGTTKA